MCALADTIHTNATCTYGPLLKRLQATPGSTFKRQLAVPGMAKITKRSHSIRMMGLYHMVKKVVDL